MGSSSYDKEFYANQRDKSRLSASLIIPYVLDVLSPISIQSVIDFGCGVGGWLAEFKANKPDIKVMGLDFGNADSDQFFIDVQDEFTKTNLCKKLELGGKYDLAMSVECAEHLSEEYADVFVDNMCNHADIIMFGAAIPGQGGVEHVNEQLQSYWVNKFKTRGYDCYDIIRPYFWNNEEIESWYRQDTFLFVKNTVDLSETKLANFNSEMPTDVASPELVRLLRAEIEESEKHLINRRYVKKRLPFLN